VSFGGLNVNNIKGLTSLLSFETVKLSTKDILQHDNGNHSEVQHKATLGIFHEEIRWICRCGISQAIEKTNKSRRIRMRLKLRNNWISLMQKGLL
jgi:hypothetical protein